MECTCEYTIASHATSVTARHRITAYLLVRCSNYEANWVIIDDPCKTCFHCSNIIIQNHVLAFHQWWWDCDVVQFKTMQLTHWGRVSHICVSKQAIIGSDNGSSPGRRQAIVWTNAGILLIWTLETNFGEMLIKIHTFSFTKMHLRGRLRNGGNFRSAPMC